MIDFSNMSKRNKTYAGANGSKISVMCDDGLYMLKFPSLPTRKTELSYTNSCISEYIGCKVYETLGIPVQKVMLGTYTTDAGKEKIVVACKDFAVGGYVLQDFGSLKNQIIDSERNGYGTELDDILSTFKQQNAIDSEELTERFWDMFIVDAFIGNWDRHNGNWGFLYYSLTDEISLAPVYDCGSSLFPQTDEKMMKDILNNKNLINDRIFNIPTSAITQNGERINYFEFISSRQNGDCNKALKKICKRIDMDKINSVIDEIPCISDIHKTFLKTILTERKEKILDFSCKKLYKSEIQKCER